jgi:hypothetical protein
MTASLCTRCAPQSLKTSPASCAPRHRASISVSVTRILPRDQPRQLKKSKYSRAKTSKKKKKGKKKATRIKKQRQGKASLPPLNPDSEPEQLVALSRFPIRTAWERDRGEKASNKREGKEPRVTHAPRKANNARAHHIFLVINILDKK